MRGETGLELTCTSVFSFKCEFISCAWHWGIKKMKIRRSLLLKNLQMHEDLFHVVSAVTEVSQGLTGTQRKGNKLIPGRSGEAFWRSDAPPTTPGGSRAEISPRKDVHLAI